LGINIKSKWICRKDLQQDLSDKSNSRLECVIHEALEAFGCKMHKISNSSSYSPCRSTCFIKVFVKWNMANESDLWQTTVEYNVTSQLLRIFQCENGSMRIRKWRPGSMSNPNIITSEECLPA
jgi:hypothetical protein